MESEAVDNWSFGHIPHAHVPEAVEAILSTCKPPGIAVIRCLDSSNDATAIARVLDAHQVSFQILNGSVCLSTTDLQLAIYAGAFVGFDEVWLLAGDRPASQMFAYSNITSDGKDFSREEPRDLRHAMRESGCIVALGDGCGLNFATSSNDISESLKHRFSGQ